MKIEVDKTTSPENQWQQAFCLADKLRETYHSDPFPMTRVLISTTSFQDTPGEHHDLLAAEGYDPTLGARPLRRAIQRLVEDPLSERLLLKEFSAGEIIVVDTEDIEDDKSDGDVDEQIVDKGSAGKRIVFRAIAGFEPPTMEMVVEGVE